MDITLMCLVFMLFTHWIADFVIQGDEIVEGTAGVQYIVEHCTKYAVVFPAGAWLVWFALMNTSFESWFWFSLINAVTHALIDCLAIPVASGYFRIGNRKWGSMSLALDQFLHSTVIVTSFVWCMG